MSLDCYRKPGNTMTLMGSSQKNYRVMVNNANKTKQNKTGELTTLFWKKKHLTTLFLRSTFAHSVILLLLFLILGSWLLLEMILSFQLIQYAKVLSAVQAQIFSVHWWSIHILLSNKKPLHNSIVSFTKDLGSLHIQMLQNLIVNVSMHSHVVLETDVRVIQLKWMHDFHSELTWRKHYRGILIWFRKNEK